MGMPEDEPPKEKQYAQTAFDVDNVRTSGGHPRTGIDCLDNHLECLETWQIEEVLTISQIKPAAGALKPRNL